MAARSIFVSIVSYRDPECMHTIDSLYQNAANPTRIYIGLVAQFALFKDRSEELLSLPKSVPSEDVRLCLSFVTFKLLLAACKDDCY
jgi:hypothetical protein